MIVATMTYTGYKVTPDTGNPFARAYHNSGIEFTVRSRHSGTGLCVVSAQVNGDSPVEGSMTGNIKMYANADNAGRTSQPMLLYRKYTENASTYTPSWTLTLVVNCQDFNNFCIPNVLGAGSGWTIKSGTIPLYSADPSYYVTSDNLSTLGTKIADAEFVTHNLL